MNTVKELFGRINSSLHGTVVVMRGLPGSGKSLLAWKLARLFKDSGVVSADDAFITKEGVYQFDPKELQRAHQACFYNFLLGVQKDKYFLNVVDNTNIRTLEASPYMLAGSSHDYQTILVTIDCPVVVALSRNTHQVPETVIRQMDVTKKLQDLEIPPWWSSMTLAYDSFEK